MTYQVIDRQTQLDLLRAAHAITVAIRADRDALDAVLAEGPSAAWWDDIFGSQETRAANIRADIEANRGRLGAIRLDLTAAGLTQSACAEIWRARNDVSGQS